MYDPEEAILLFLEQDQDITLTVARKPKVHTSFTLIQMFVHFFMPNIIVVTSQIANIDNL